MPEPGENLPPTTDGGKPPSGGGLGSLSKNQKIGYGIGAFVVVAGGVWLYAKHKSSSSTSTTSAPEVIQPSTPASNQDTMPSQGGSLGAGGGSFGGGSLAAELASIKTELALLATGAAPLPGTSTSPLSTTNPGGPLQLAPPPVVDGYSVEPSTPITVAYTGGTVDTQVQPSLAGQVVSTAPASSSQGQLTTAINNNVLLNGASAALGYGNNFSSLTPAQQQQAIMYAAV